MQKHIIYVNKIYLYVKAYSFCLAILSLWSAIYVYKCHLYH